MDRAPSASSIIRARAISPNLGKGLARKPTYCRGLVNDSGCLVTSEYRNQCGSGFYKRGNTGREALLLRILAMYAYPSLRWRYSQCLDRQASKRKIWRTMIPRFRKAQPRLFYHDAPPESRPAWTVVVAAKMAAGSPDVPFFARMFRLQ